MIYRELLPNGEEFAAWTDKTVYRRTLHVSAAAQPGGDGSRISAKGRDYLRA